MTLLLTAAQMREADRLAIAAGTPGIELMERAGRAAAEVAAGMAGGGPIAILCGPGNNGGDGFVMARLLAAQGREVTVGLIGDRGRLVGDAALAAAAWTGPVDDASAIDLSRAAIVVDALFGTGLARPLAGDAAAVVEAMNGAGRPVLAVDMPSGVDSDTGAVLGTAVRATRTVTFAARKPGQLLMPGRRHCGAIALADMGIPPDVLNRVAGSLHANEPPLWEHAYPRIDDESHKYTRGHALVLSGPSTRTGAARLAARAALRAGAGLVTLAAPRSALLVAAAQLTAIMLRPCDGAGDLAAILEDPRYAVVALGPGYGVGEETRAAVAVAAAARRGLVLDADALTSFAGATDDLAQVLAGTPAVLTPHGGEFARLLGDVAGASKVDRASEAAARLNAVIVLKGADTVIAAPDGRAAINAHASPYLATAGSGDVLAGLIAGLMAQGMAPFEAACAGVWLHGDAGLRLGPGLIAEDLPEAMPAVLRDLLSGHLDPGP